MGVARPAAIFLNEGAGSGRSARARRLVELASERMSADLHVTATRSPEVLRAWLEERIGGYATAVVVGGDGTLSIACNVAARGSGPILGYLPAGFGNAAAHLLRLPSDPEGMVDVLERGDARPVDLVGVGDRLALFAGAGWDALAAGRYADAGARGLVGWTAAIGRSVPDLWRRQPVEVRADGWVVHRGPLLMAVVGTTPFYGRGMRVNPGARTDAGRLSLRVYAGPAPRLAIEAGRWLAGALPHAERVDAERVELRSLDGSRLPLQADGDVIGAEGAWTLEIRPQAVRLIGRWD